MSQKESEKDLCQCGEYRRSHTIMMDPYHTFVLMRDESPDEGECPKCKFNVRFVDGKPVPHDIDGLEPNGPGYWNCQNAEGVGHTECQWWRK